MIKGEKLADRGQYRRMIGKLICLSHTRPDIAYAVGLVSRFMQQPHIQDMTTMMRILRYIKGTNNRGILFKKNDHSDLLTYTDANWVGDRDDRRSTSGYFTLVGGNLVKWRSKKKRLWLYLVQR